MEQNDVCPRTELGALGLRFRFLCAIPFRFGHKSISYDSDQKARGSYPCDCTHGLGFALGWDFGEFWGNIWILLGICWANRIRLGVQLGGYNAEPLESEELEPYCDRRFMFIWRS